METVRTRCPSCSKLFAVQLSDVISGKPQFQCNKCETQFWFQAPPPPGVNEVPSKKLDNAPSQQQAQSTQSNGETPVADPNTNSGLGFSGIALTNDKPESTEGPTKTDEGPLPQEDAATNIPTDEITDEVTNTVGTVTNTIPKPQALPQTDVHKQAEIKEPLEPNQADSNEIDDKDLLPELLASHPGDEFPCPNCEKPNKKGTPECLYCGIFFEKFLKKKEKDKLIANRKENELTSPGTKPEIPTEPPSTLLAESADNISPPPPEAKENTASGVIPAPIVTVRATDMSLVQHWEGIMENYENKTLHEDFVQKALDSKSLQYASQQYRGILEGNPNDEIAKHMRDRIIGLTMATYTPVRREERKSFRLGITGSIAILGTLVLILGLLLPQLPKTITVIGAGISVVGIAMRFMSSRSTK